ncbi:MAG: FAD:protein FMN transferase [Bryobacteraceae bacterium]|nr:FAD:protein FMN transferase [Bryobacteraceae bacterium]
MKEFIWFIAWTLHLFGAYQAPEHRLERAEPAMGTVARIVVEADDERAATAALNAAFARIREIEQRLSDYIDTSEARQLERAPIRAAVPVSPDLYRVLEHGLNLARATGGAFDPTLGRATRAWREGKTPAKGRYRSVRLADGAVVLLAEGIAFDFGGIAKGYAADEALKVLRTRGFPRAMVALSGDIALGDAPADRKGWRVGLGSKDLVEELANRGASTSGDAHQARRGESHILDGRAGAARRARPGSVTVIAPTAMEADALATAIHAMGKEEAEKGLLPKAGFRVFFRSE